MSETHSISGREFIILGMPPGREAVNVLGAVLNRAENGEEWIEEIERVLETRVVVIPESRVVKEAYEMGECFVVVAMESEPSREVMALAEKLVRIE